MTLSYAAAALKKYFGYDAFRPLQADIIQSIYDKRDALVLMPTGGGKSVCYQVPAVTMEGIAVVVSPLIALMKDQVEGLSANGIPAAFLNSSIDGNQVRSVENALLAGYVKILYVSPEKMVSQGFQPLLKRLKISLFAIDEAHCISAWGHDFRPEYTQLRFLKEQYPHTPLVALTATADKLTRKDIIDQLGLQDPHLYIASFDRPNISMTVRPGQKRFEQIVAFLKEHPNQSGIIYCLARKTCEEIAGKLQRLGFKAAHYHAELSGAQRNRVQEDFINDRVPIICATIAFGMGIDKSNVRFVIHYNLPRNLEGYYQEIGRAGRDGLASDALLFFSYADVSAYREMIEKGESSQEQKDLKIAKLNRMYQFAEAPVCRRKTVLNYFGEHYDRSCGNCDVCKNPPRSFDGTVAVQKALSAILRTQERVGINLLIEILRGSNRREIFEKDYHKVKTYGAGREYSFDEWQFLVSQMLHLGLIEIAYDDFNVLKATEAGRAVLFDGKKIALALPQPKEKERPAPAPKTARETATGKKTAAPKSREKMPYFKEKTPAQHLREEMFERLVALRRQVSQEQGIPPYLIFSDATLSEMVEKRPLTDADMLRVSGVGEKKLRDFGEIFIAEIRRFVLEKSDSGLLPRVAGQSFVHSLELYRQGKTVEEIASEREISPVTVKSHLATAYERGEQLDLSEWIGEEELDIIKGALPLFSEPFVLKDIFAHFNERYSFDQIRWAVADSRRKS